MSADQHIPDAYLNRLHTCTRPGPRCYTRTRWVAADEGRIGAENKAVFLVLGITTCAAAFLLFYSAWGL
jgi:hypothetical protein